MLMSELWAPCNAAEHYWYKLFSYDTLWSPICRPFPLQPLATHEQGTATLGARSICMDGKSVGGGLELMEHTQTIPALNEGVPPSNV